MLTMKTRYALKALTQLAQQPGSTVLIASLAERGRIPRKFLESILRELKNHGLLASQRGRGGGYSLKRAAEDITLANIIDALDGDVAPVACISRDVDRPCEVCRNGGTCGVRLVLEDLHEATASILERTTLAELTRRTELAEAPAYRRAV
jgi:Rrf2 family protein